MAADAPEKACAQLLPAPPGHGRGSAEGAGLAAVRLMGWDELVKVVGPTFPPNLVLEAEQAGPAVEHTLHTPFVVRDVPQDGLALCRILLPHRPYRVSREEIGRVRYLRINGTV